MHICFFSILGISKHSPSWGGVQTHAKNLVSLLIKEGHKVTFITGSGEPVQSGSLAIKPVGQDFGARPDKSWFQKAYRAFSEVHRNHPVDCVFSEGTSVLGSIKLMNDYQIPVIAFVHSLSMHYFHNKWQEVDGARSFKSYLLRTIPTVIHDIFLRDIAFLKKCQKVVTGSSTIRRQLKRFYRLPSEKVRVVHNWVNPSEFQSDKTARKRLRIDLNIVEDDLVFLLVGSLWKPKGFRTTLHAFQDFIRTVPSAHLVISGDGADRLYFEKHATKSDELRRRIKLLGNYPHEELSMLYSFADVFIIPSIMNEVLPYTLLEAMSCQLPIIASDIAANKEALGSGGWFFPRGDKKALKKLMLHFASDLSKKRTEAALNRKRVIEFFSSEMASTEINNLIGEILEIKRELTI
jgi:glycosyltransferase involved in cell wall biosynthesis